MHIPVHRDGAEANEALLSPDEETLGRYGQFSLQRTQLAVAISWQLGMECPHEHMRFCKYWKRHRNATEASSYVVGQGLQAYDTLPRLLSLLKTRARD